MRRFVTPARPEHIDHGKQLILYGALALMALCGYQLYEQFTTNKAWLKALARLSKARGTNVVSDFMIMLEEQELRLVFARMLFLLALFIISYIIIRLRRSVRGCLWAILLSLLSAGAGVAIGLYSLSGWLRLMELLPLAVIVVGCVLQVTTAVLSAWEANRGVQIRRTGRAAGAASQDGGRSRRARIFRDAPGVAKALPDARTPLEPGPVRQKRRPAAAAPVRLEKPAPSRSDYHIGQVVDQPEEKKRHEWKTIKK